MATVGTLVPVAYQTALWMTGVPEEFLRAYKERFGADFQKGHTLIPIAPIDPETKKLKTVDADTLLPYSDVQLPFKIFMETYQAGKKVEENGAGEILLTSMDRDGTKIGYDLEILSLLSQTMTIPIIASGGAGTLNHIADVFTVGKADAALCASIFHFGEYTISDAKNFLSKQGILVRD